MRLFLLLCLISAPVYGQTCPDLPDRSALKADLMSAARFAPDAAAGRKANDELWKFWTFAPDAKARELLDYGMRRRAEYDFEGAATAFDKLVAYCPKYAEGYNQRAFVNFLREDFQTALEDLEKTLEIEPDHYGALAGLAMTLHQLGRIETGQSVLRQALRFNSWLPERGMLIKQPGEDI